MARNIFIPFTPDSPNEDISKSDALSILEDTIYSYANFDIYHIHGNDTTNIISINNTDINIKTDLQNIGVSEDGNKVLIQGRIRQGNEYAKSIQIDCENGYAEQVANSLWTCHLIAKEKKRIDLNYERIIFKSAEHGDKEFHYTLPHRVESAWIKPVGFKEPPSTPFTTSSKLQAYSVCSTYLDMNVGEVAIGEGGGYANLHTNMVYYGDLVQGETLEIDMLKLRKILVDNRSRILLSGGLRFGLKTSNFYILKCFSLRDKIAQCLLETKRWTE